MVTEPYGNVVLTVRSSKMQGCSVSRNVMVRFDSTLEVQPLTGTIETGVEERGKSEAFVTRFPPPVLTLGVDFCVGQQRTLLPDAGQVLCGREEDKPVVT